MQNSDVLIIGSGIAALQLAKQLADHKNVMIITKSKLEKSNSYLAQGGIAAAISEVDHFEKHLNDTLVAGEFHNDEEIVQELTKTAPFLIKELIAENCPFDRDENGVLQLGMEGAHSEKRIIHSGGDATGKMMIDFFTGQMPKQVEVYENIFAFDLLMDHKENRCFGVKGKDRHGNIQTFYAQHIVLATGGCGHLFKYTSNDENVIGDGIALAYRVGANITDMEFIQFHPTLLYKDGKTRGLVSEAVRGEGGRLVTKSGQSVMGGVHPLGDLAPRHIVAQTIFQYLENGEEVFIDISAISNFTKRFPTIAKLCEENSIDLNKQLIPVVPGSHFLMGGIKTDHVGCTNINGLYAIGEVARTGIHGANRLASNSLLEGLFMGKRLAEYMIKQPETICIRKESEGMKDPFIITLPEIKELKEQMMSKVGIVRNEIGLTEQLHWLEQYDIEKLTRIDLTTLNKKDIEKIFMLITATLITKSALGRTESRGGHLRSDYPMSIDQKWLKKEIIQSIHSEKRKKNEHIKTTSTA